MEIKEYLSPLRKWWWLIVVTTLVAGVSSYLATRQRVPIYRASTRVMIGTILFEQNPSSAQFSTASQLTSTYVDIANGATVRGAAAEALGLPLLPEVVVQQSNNTNIINITVTDTDPIRAQAVAAEMANQLILLTPEADDGDDEFINELLTGFERSISDAQDELAAKREELVTLTSAREIATIQNEISSLESSLQQLITDFASLRRTTQQGAINKITVIEPATAPTRPQDPQDLFTIMTAASIGLVLSAGAAYVLEYMDDTIKTPDNIERLVKLPTLAGIAEIKTDDSALVTISHPRAPVSEAFRVLRTGIQFSSVDRSNHTLLVTSSTPLEGKSTISANLAVVMAQSGRNVLLVDSDLRRPSQHRIFGLPNKRGLTSLLLELEVNADPAIEVTEALISEVAQTTRVEGLLVLTSGPIPPNPSELLGSTKMDQLLECLAGKFDFVIFDSPPVLSVTDAAVLSVQTDSTLVVVRANKSRRVHLEQSVEQLREVHATLAGCILNNISRKSGAYSLYYYYREPYYDEDPDQDADTEATKPIGRLRRRFLRGESQTA